jgi:hypothetical protein
VSDAYDCECPTCGAAPNFSCVNGRNEMRASAHDERRAVALVQERDALAAEIDTLRARVGELEKESESWRKANHSWQAWAADLLHASSAQPVGGEWGDGQSRVLIRKLIDIGVAEVERMHPVVAAAIKYVGPDGEDASELDTAVEDYLAALSTADGGTL